MSDQQTICGPEAEPEFGGFQPIEMDMGDDTPTLEDCQIVEGAGPATDELAGLKTKIVRKVLGGVVGLPNFYFVSRDEEPLMSLDLDIYDQQADNLAVRASAQLADMLDLSPATAKWLAKAVDWEKKYGDLGQLGGAMLANLALELKQRAAAKKEAAKDEAQADEDKPQQKQPEQGPTVAGVDPERGIIDEPEE